MTLMEVLNNPEEIAKRARYMYWIPDDNYKAGGYYKTVKTKEEIPQDIPFNECIICNGLDSNPPLKLLHHELNK